MKSNIKKIIIIIAICLLFITMLLILNLRKEAEKDKEKFENMVPVNNVSEEYTDENEAWEEVTKVTDYYAIKNAINKYYNYITDYTRGNSSYISRIPSEDSAENNNFANEEALNAVKGILSTYINISNKRENELKEMLKNYSNEALNIEKMYYKYQGKLKDTYFIKGVLNNSKKDYCIIIIVDREKNIYTLLPNEYIVEEYGESLNLNDLKFSEELLNIESYGYNRLKQEAVSQEIVCLYYFGDYLNKLNGDTKKLYEVLDEDYKKERFPTYEEFIKYINDNYSTLKECRVTEYSVNMTDDNKAIMYICKDQNANYYIFKAKAVMNYSLFLDNHTIDLPEFIEKYNQAKNENKVGMNIEKIKDAINTKDYKYVYEKLDTTFKNNNFGTLEQFETYAKNVFNNYNSFSYTDIQEQNGMYIFTVEVTDVDGRSSEGVKMNFIMQLKEGTDFTMSFSIE